MTIMTIRNTALNLLLITVTLAAVPAVAQTVRPRPTPAAGAAAPGTSDKLDVQDLEKKYWASKDTDFSVVQNRTYSKAGRFSVGANAGMPLLDNYNTGYVYGVDGNYYFTERYGVGLTYSHADLKQNEAVDAYRTSNGGVEPDHNRATNFYGASFNWVPIYAKMSLLNSRIIYFDMSFSPGIGMAGYHQESISGGSDKTSPAATFDITQHFFFSNHFALRADWRHRWYNQDVISWRYGNTLRTPLEHESILTFGATYFF